MFLLFSGDLPPRTLRRLDGIGKVRQQKLKEAGIENTRDIALADAPVIASIVGVGEEQAAGWIEQAWRYHAPRPEPLWTQYPVLERLFHRLRARQRSEFYEKEREVLREFLLPRDYTYDSAIVSQVETYADKLEQRGQISEARDIRSLVADVKEGRTTADGHPDYWVTNSRHRLGGEAIERAKEDLAKFSPVREELSDIREARKEERALVLREILRKEFGPDWREVEKKERIRLLKNLFYRPTEAGRMAAWWDRQPRRPKDEIIAIAAECSESYARDVTRRGRRVYRRSSLTTHKRELIIERDGGGCVVCGQEEDLELHHLKSKKTGGSESPDNLLTLCSECHKKADHTFVNYSPEDEGFWESYKEALPPSGQSWEDLKE